MNNVDKMTPDIFATYMEVNSYIQKVNETKQREETEVLTKKVKDKFEE